MTAMALTSQRSRTSRTLRRLSLKLGTLVIAALAVTMALGLAAPAASQAAVSVQRLGYCGGGDGGPTLGAPSNHHYARVAPYAREPRRVPARAADKPPGTILLFARART